MADTADPINVLITVKFDAESLASFRDVSNRLDILYYPARQAREVPDDIWAKTQVLYTSSVVPELAQTPQLRWVHVHSAGVDHLIDQPVFQSENVVLTNASGIHSTNIAEYVFTMMLAFGHRLPTLIEYQAAATWPDEQRMLRLMPLELRGSTIGIVGYGSIGREVARIASALGMEVLAIKRDVRHPAELDEYNLPGTGDPDGQYFHRLYPPEALHSLVRESDFVVLTVPLVEATRGMFGADAFAAMKQTAFLINVSRGGIVDEDALIQALQNKQIAGAAMDVFEAEPLAADSSLWKQPRLIISPHISGMTGDYNEKAATLFIENLQRYIQRKELLNVVNRSWGY
ncbi:MAG TPA: D-2-hydroxyacid dehydrogenase [Aggregatilineaceae bacterium]|nr:D-2-hydroxyacid dehydrogenase [Aggregatilineaceae bacterium]